MREPLCSLRMVKADLRLEDATGLLCALPLLVCGGVERGEPLCILRIVNERTPVQPPHGEGRLAPEDATGLLCAPPLLVCGRGRNGRTPLCILRMLSERTSCPSPAGQGEFARVKARRLH